jgi:hypothetical protein
MHTAQVSPGMMTIHCDNQGVIALSKNNKFHARMKHIDIQYHFIRLSIKYIPGTNNPANIFTKALPKATFIKFVKKLGLGTLEGEC